jgi:hypothetical protein
MAPVSRPVSTLAAIVIAGVLTAGCGSKGSSAAPSACAAPARDYVKALQAAPGAVRLDDTAISDCFTGEEDPNVAHAVIGAVSRLNAQARRDPAGPATVRLGYLVGAVHKGTAHVPSDADLVRRVDTASRYAPGGGSLGARFERAFGKGYAAGEATG